MNYIVWLTILIAGSSLILAIYFHEVGANELQQERYTVDQPLDNWGNNTDLDIRTIRGSDGHVKGHLNTYTAPETGHQTQEIIIDPSYYQE